VSYGDYYIGIDGGGTGTRAILAGRDGQVCGYGQAGSANRNHYPREQVRASLQAALRGALAGLPPGGVLAGVFCGLGGVSTEADKRDILSVMRGLEEVGASVPVTVENDTVVALTGGLAGRPGLALIAGTGSACLGMNAAGERRLCGGWGALADDVGSAPWVGLRALQEVVRAEDGRRPPTALQTVVFEFLGLAEPRRLISRVHNHGLDRADLGQLAPLVADACRAGDTAASEILAEAARGLSEMVAVVARDLFGERVCEMILVGGLARSGPPFQPLLLAQVQSDCPAATVRDPELSPVRGAVLEALRTAGVPWTPEVLANLSK